VTLSDFATLARGLMATPSYCTAELRGEPALARAREVVTAIRARWEALNDAWAGDALKTEIKSVGKELGVKGKELFFPIRAALTGSLHGPELDGILTLLGRETTLTRLNAFLTAWTV